MNMSVPLCLMASEQTAEYEHGVTSPVLFRGGEVIVQQIETLDSLGLRETLLTDKLREMRPAQN